MSHEIEMPGEEIKFLSNGLDLLEVQLIVNTRTAVAALSFHLLFVFLERTVRNNKVLNVNELRHRGEGCHFKHAVNSVHV